mmetsp:Transcript_64108/g.119199  ORF Transcript_64108/g.119199 Transcript_64108/m.119199 type:complete len:194 (-) Transcript_64108:60-641(-)
MSSPVRVAAWAFVLLALHGHAREISLLRGARQVEPRYDAGWLETFPENVSWDLPNMDGPSSTGVVGNVSFQLVPFSMSNQSILSLQQVVADKLLDGAIHPPTATVVLMPSTLSGKPHEKADSSPPIVEATDAMTVGVGSVSDEVTGLSEALGRRAVVGFQDDPKAVVTTRLATGDVYSKCQCCNCVYSCDCDA